MENPAVIAAIIAAVAAILVALIGLISRTKAPPSNTTEVKATGGAAAGRDIRDSPINITGSDRETTSHEKPEGIVDGPSRAAHC